MSVAFHACLGFRKNGGKKNLSSEQPATREYYRLDQCIPFLSKNLSLVLKDLFPYYATYVQFFSRPSRKNCVSEFSIQAMSRRKTNLAVGMKIAGPKQRIICPTKDRSQASQRTGCQVVKILAALLKSVRREMSLNLVY